MSEPWGRRESLIKSVFVVPVSDGNKGNFKSFHCCWQSISTEDLLYFSESFPPIKAVGLFGFCLYCVFAGRRALLFFRRLITNIK